MQRVNTSAVDAPGLVELLGLEGPEVTVGELVQRAEEKIRDLIAFEDRAWDLEEIVVGLEQEVRELKLDLRFSEELVGSLEEELELCQPMDEVTDDE